jgi:hypothetical protein
MADKTLLAHPFEGVGGFQCPYLSREFHVCFYAWVSAFPTDS